MKKIATGIGVLTLLVLGIAIGVRLQPRSAPEQPQMSQLDAEQAFDRGDFTAALSIAEKLLEKTPHSIALRMLAGESAMRTNEFDKALEHYAEVPDRVPEAATARWAMGQIYYQLGRMPESLDALEQSLKLDPEFAPAHEAKVGILNTLGRRRETLPHLLKLFQTDNATLEHLLHIGNLSKLILAQGEIERIRRANPQDLSINLPLAIHAREQGQFDQASRLLAALIAQQPTLLEARLQQGWLLLNTDPNGLAAWADTLPGEAFEHPDAWYLIGQAAQKRGDDKPAIRCALEAIARDPDHLQAHLTVAQLVRRDGHGDRAQAFAQRAELLQQLNLALEQIYTSRRYLPPVEEAARLAYQLGRMWEAVGWSAYALSVDSKLEWPQSILEEVRTRIEPNSPRTLAEFNLAALATWKQEYPLPSRAAAQPDRSELSRATSATGGTSRGEPAGNGVAKQGTISFEDVADAAGVHFTLAQPPRSAGGGKRMFESTGSGAGAIDFDSDGWCDLFVAQASTHPPGEERPARKEPGDRLLRNFGVDQLRGVARFGDVSGQSRIQESGFGQGVAVADVDSDGFDDIYVCNFGRNQLWLNQGDGTFRDGNRLFPADAAAHWTVSAAIADLNLDGRPEIYDANYVTGPEVLTRLCDVAGKPRVCPPLVFNPAPHALWIPDPQGDYHSFAGDGAETLQGYGLGVVAYRASEKSVSQVFVAIDQEANLLLTAQPSGSPNGKTDAETVGGTLGAPDSGLKIQNEAIVRGAAFDSAGRSQACMGIAAGDVNADGQVDLYVTNFYNESNTLYLQDSGFYRDATAEYNLVAPSLPVLGFGTQFLDFELDGRADIVVLNGHIDDLSHVGAPYRMRPQVFQQRATGKYEELAAEAVGEFFQKPALGRTLAKGDFNRDGLEDLVATDLEAPLALLLNRSQAIGKHVTVRLVGTRSDRNAFFTQATLGSDDFRQQLQLVAGGGYMASNERCLHFAVPADSSALTLQLEWPSGTSETCRSLQAGFTYVVVEGRGIVQSYSAESE